MKLWLARHAQPAGAEGLCYGSTDLPAGVTPTRAAARRLAAALPQGLRVACSPLSRCAQLGQYLQVLRPDLAPMIDARLAEMDFGDWEGRPWEAIGKEALDAWSRDFAHHRPGGGESAAGFMARVGAAFDELRGDALWITHAGVARAALLLSRGQRTPGRSDEWPVQAPAFGEFHLLELGNRAVRATS